ncbi:ERF family protein [Henriciella sp.]|uniref:ERF family protein n=1 Tax=Henriciella sp. TaxID=1968823 RepID=UPI000C10978D|nr:ERF family protein [Henriciella sp.]PHR83135.1 MAG: hypothetical protein COA64_00320 [Henriciella sp.]
MAELATTERRQELAAQEDHQPMELMQVIAQAARDPQVDVNKMQALLQMKREEEDRDAQRLFNRAFVACKKEVRPVYRNKYNEQTKSKYADGTAVADVIDPVQEEHGFSISYSTAQSARDGYYKIIGKLIHEEGHTELYEADIPEDKTGIKGTANKTDTHAFGSSMTYGRRYLKLLIWDLVVKDDDGQRAGMESQGTMTTQQVQHLKKLIKEAGGTEEAFIKFLNTQKVPGDTLEEMPFEAYESARRSLQRRIENAATTSNKEKLQ